MEDREDEAARTSKLYRDAGLVPSSERVWSGGIDVTHEPPSTWPWPYSLYVSGKRGPALRAQYLAWHTEALTTHEGRQPPE